MQFIVKRKRTPQIVLVSLMDVLAILLIFFMVTTTFKKALPEVQLKLPEARQSQDGSSVQNEPLILTIDKDDKMWIGSSPVTFDSLDNELKSAKEKQDNLILEIRSDEKASFGTIIKVMDAAKVAQIDNIKALTRKPDIEGAAQ
ncbi:biopolymer transporter ExbD [Oscillatoria amoena NRMC-F 0135]|nr:biopolymer transporter ExbD [Oscillatoria laete-virens]MDL5049115.1 biopolymer transporter ExbD [Oscillatoria amoena NRMC-F 0135]MDL5054001.1 biopolymer transporter ExbD [Oscillatoria laete-virens NRMC-F 0139]